MRPLLLFAATRLVPDLTLEAVELALLFRAVPHDAQLKHLRDRALLGLFGLQALRTVEITRANVDDLQQRGESWALLVHGKFHDRLVFLRPDVADAVRAYLAARGTLPPTSSARRCSSPTTTSPAAFASADAACATSSTATCARPTSSALECPTTHCATPAPRSLIAIRVAMAPRELAPGTARAPYRGPRSASIIC